MLVVELLLLSAAAAAAAADTATLRRLACGWSLVPDAVPEPLRPGVRGLLVAVRLAGCDTDDGSAAGTADGTGEVATRDSKWGAQQEDSYLNM